MYFSSFASSADCFHCFVVIFSVFTFSMPSKGAMVGIQFMFLSINCMVAIWPSDYELGPRKINTCGPKLCCIIVWKEFQRLSQKWISILPDLFLQNEEPKSKNKCRTTFIYHDKSPLQKFSHLKALSKNDHNNKIIHLM